MAFLSRKHVENLTDVSDFARYCVGATGAVDPGSDDLFDWSFHVFSSTIEETHENPNSF